MKDNVLEKKKESALNPQTGMGLIVVAVGVLFLVGQFFDIGFVLRFMPLLFVGLGIWQLFSNGFRNWVGPAIMIAIASFVQLSILGVTIVSSVWNLWPLILVGVGVSMLMSDRHREDDWGKAVDPTESFHAVAIFSGADRKITSQDFVGGDATAIFGGAEIDLTNANVEDRPAVINTFAMFGGIEIKASPDMLIESRVVAIFGGTGDGRSHQRKKLSGEQPEVIIKGFAMFGGISIEE